jgi:hypothetical protein
MKESLLVVACAGVSIVLTNLSSNIAGATPLLATLPLFTTGLGMVGLSAYRKKRHHRDCVPSKHLASESTP